MYSLFIFYYFRHVPNKATTYFSTVFFEGKNMTFFLFQSYQHIKSCYLIFANIYEKCNLVNHTLMKKSTKYLSLGN